MYADRVPPLVHREELLVLEDWPNRLYRPPKTRDFSPDEDAFAAPGLVGRVEIVEGEAGQNFTRDDAIESIRPVDAAECEVLKQRLRRSTQCDQRRVIERIGNPDALE